MPLMTREKNSMNFTCKGKSQAGAGLIEVMVAVLIISVGVLGAIALQISSKRLGHEAVQRTLAANLAWDLIERMRVNPNQLANYVRTWESGDAIPAAGTDCGEDVIPAPSCTEAELAAYDVEQWLDELQGASETREIVVGAGQVRSGGLQQPTVCITNVDRFVTVAIAWRGYQALSDPGVSTCGDDTGLYDGDNDNEYRQVLSFSTYIKSL